MTPIRNGVLQFATERIKCMLLIVIWRAMLPEQTQLAVLRSTCTEAEFGHYRIPQSFSHRRVPGDKTNAWTQKLCYRSGVACVGSPDS
jgi:hypothetical protein